MQALERGAARPRFVAAPPEQIECRIPYQIEIARKLDEHFTVWLNFESSHVFVDAVLADAARGEAASATSPHPKKHEGVGTPPRGPRGGSADSPFQSARSQRRGLSSSLTQSMSVNSMVSSVERPHIPKFYFPDGSLPEGEEILHELSAHFRDVGSRGLKVNDPQWIAVVHDLDLSAQVAPLLFSAIDTAGSGVVSRDEFIAYWRTTLAGRDAAAKFFAVVKRSPGPHLVADDLVPLLRHIVRTHPGLDFLGSTPEFQARYIESVIARVFYYADRSWARRLSLQHLRSSTFLEELAALDREADTNVLTTFFAYDHFYVLYCKFWELDTDHDLLLSREDLAKHDSYALTPRIIARIFDQSGIKLRSGVKNRLGFEDFIFFFLSEQDKSTASAIEYWFRLVDVDGDGAVSIYEIEYFYEEQAARMDTFLIEVIFFDDLLCQLLDVVRPATPARITLADLKRCQHAPFFFDALFNLSKFLTHEHKERAQLRRALEAEDRTEWERYARVEYARMCAEESDMR
eukprot:Amastigsp_a342470_10.p1 type:complete len:518 gc:universal Amastigsp_a342470_10:52-1605(+)